MKEIVNSFEEVKYRGKEVNNNNSGEDIRHQDAICTNESDINHKWYSNLKYALVGLGFGLIFVKAEVISWFRIQEMFRFQSFHMYGIIGSAILVGAISVLIIKKFKIKTVENEIVSFKDKTFNKGQIYGGFLFGLGWAMTGACPGPLYAIIGTGATVIIVTLLSAIAGTYVYGMFREKLPH